MHLNIACSGAPSSTSDGICRQALRGEGLGVFSVVGMQLSAAGLPVAVMSDGAAHAYSAGMAAWMRVADGAFPASPFHSLLQGPSGALPPLRAPQTTCLGTPTFTNCHDHSTTHDGNATTSPICCPSHCPFQLLMQSTSGPTNLLSGQALSPRDLDGAGRTRYDHQLKGLDRK